MALPRYQNVGVEVGGGVRALDFPNRGETVRGIDAISHVLDKMSESFFKEAATAATAEGEKYGAQNAPTQEQLKQAIKSGTPLPPVGDLRTYFGKAAKNAYSDVLTTQIQYAAKADIAKIKSDAEAGAIGTGSIIPRINSVIKGYSGALADVDPALGKKIEAHLAYEGNNAYLAASKSAASKAAAELKTQNVINGYDLVNTVADDFKAGDTIGADGTMVTVNDRVDIRAAQLRQITAKLPAAAAKELEAKFNKEIATQQKNYVLDWVMSGADTPDREARRRAIEDSFSKKGIDPTLDPNGSYYRVIKSMEPTEVRDTIKVSNDLLSIRQREDERLFKKQDAEMFDKQSNSYEDFVYKIEAARRGQGDIPSIDDLKKSGLPVSGNQGINQTNLLKQINSLEFGEVKRDNGVYQDLYSRASLPETDPNRLKSSEEIRQAVATGRIRNSDAVALYDVMRNAKTPEGRLEESAKATFLRSARNSLTRKDPMTGISQGDDAYLAAEQEFNAEYTRRKALGDSPADLLDPKNPNSLWKIVLDHQKNSMDLLREQANKLRAQPGQPSYQPPGNIDPRKTGESISDYLNRTGQK